MKQATSEKIMRTWRALEDDTISTERLMQMVADACGVSVDDVAAALSEVNEGEHGS